jgi:hypothetical protein
LLIKKGIYSGTKVSNDVTIHILDGHNNPGFSGGPVFIKDYDMPVETTPEGENKRWSLFGVRTYKW